MALTAVNCPIRASFPPPISPRPGNLPWDNGLEVSLVERHTVPAVYMNMQFGGGAAYDGGKSGLAGFTLDMLDEGLKRKSAAEISDQIASMGGTLFASVSENKANFMLSSLSDELARAIPLFAEMLARPAFRDADVERVRKTRLSGIGGGDMFQMLSYQLPLIAYGREHPYGRYLAGIGSPMTIPAITRDDLVNYHRNYITPANARLVVVGDTSEAELKPLLNKALGKWKNTGTATLADTLPAVPANKNKARAILVNQPGANQTLILAMRTLGQLSTKEDAALSVFNDAIGHAGTGRLNNNLRADKGWSYGALSMPFAKPEGALWVALAQVRADKTVESVKEFIEEFDGIKGDKPVTRAELASARQNWSAKMLTDLETNGGVIQVLLNDYNLDRPDNFNRDYLQALETLSLDQVNAMAERVLDPSKMIWLIMGDFQGREKEIEALGLGEVEHWRGMQEAFMR